VFFLKMQLCRANSAFAFKCNGTLSAFTLFRGRSVESVCRIKVEGTTKSGLPLPLSPENLCRPLMGSAAEPMCYYYLRHSDRV